MLRKNIDRDWEFISGKPSEMPIPGVGAKPRAVNLPHDFMIETNTYAEAPGGSMTGYYGGGIGTYTKMLEIPDECEGQRILVEFDGSYMNTTVTLNGHVVTRHHYGYTPFHADLTPYLKAGKPNRLAVIVNNEAQPNSRWYSGGGLYRHVDLLTAPKIHIAPWGIFAYTTHVVDGNAFVVVETTIENHTGETKDVWADLQIKKEADDSPAGYGRVKVHVPAGENAVGRVKIAVENADIWDIDAPALYKIEAALSDNETWLDTDTAAFGIRTISVDTKNGFMLNGRTVKLKGGCVHHDNGILGAASFRDSEYRKMKIHKENGYNAIRFAHNPMSRDLLDACDRLGLLVMDEAFDVWTMEKNTHDYSLYFEQDWEADMEAFVVRDRNHPCVIMWSIGNEIIERGGMSNGYEWSAKLTECVRKLDHTRFITSALCSFFNGLDDDDKKAFFQALYEEMQSGAGNIINLDNGYGRSIWAGYTEAYASPLDVVGYNYLNYHYESALEQFPNRVICCTESKPGEMETYWADAERFSHVIGDFNWTSHDYLGEAGIGKQLYVDKEDAEEAAMAIHQSPFPWRTAHDADFDLCGFARPQSAYRKIIWGSDETYLAVHNPKNYDKAEVLGRYGWPDCEHTWTHAGMEGKPVKADVYSAAQEVELILNGRCLGRKAAGKDNHYMASFELTYEPGILKAVSYTDGKEVSADTLKSSGEAAAIRITPDKTVLAADGQSLCFAVIEAVDKEGNFVWNAERLARATVEGAGVLAAFGTGKPDTDENYTTGEFTSYRGKMLAIVRSGYETGKAVLTVTMEGLGEAVLELECR